MQKFLTVSEAAEMLGCPPQKIRQGIIKNQWNPPIGSAIQGNGEKYSFNIPLRRVENYLLILPKQQEAR